MTIKQPRDLTLSLPYGPDKMYGGSSNLCHDYSGPQAAMLDHSLQTELQICASSPNSLSIYEQDFDIPCSMGNSGDGPNMNDLGQLDELDLKSEIECCDLLNLDMKSIHSTSFDDTSSSRDPVWSPSVSGLLKMEDVFQVDQNDAIQGPTLAELNGDQSTSLLDDVENMMGLERYTSKPCVYPTDVKPQITSYPASCSDSGGIQALGKAAAPAAFSVSGTFSLFPPTESVKATSKQTCTQGAPVVEPMESENKTSLKRLLAANPPPQPRKPSLCSTRSQQQPSATLSRPDKRSESPGADSTGSNNSMDRKWEEIKQFIHDDLSTLRRDDTEPLRTIKTEPEDPAYTPQEDVESMDEGLDSDSDDSDNEVFGDDYDDGMLSDTGSFDSQMSFIEEDATPETSKKGKRYFWQYNTQSKGPKGKRLCKSVDSDDPHVLNDFKDPVFDPNLNQNQYKHNGKARRGDGNDITPSPLKLFQIGNELKKLNRIINDLTPVSELPVNARSRSRKEKNKLASRACRLKKKAQHEANKVKLYGLHQEHEQLLDVLEIIREEIDIRLENPAAQEGESMTSRIDKLVRAHCAHKVAGNSTKFVNAVLTSVAAGDSKGGLGG